MNFLNRWLFACAICWVFCIALAQDDEVAPYRLVDASKPEESLATGPEWEGSFTAAMAAAERDNKLVLLYMNAVW